MTTMIDKMARAMILAVSPDRDFTMNPYYEVERNYWERIIRAGLNTMLEPSRAMINAVGGPVVNLEHADDPSFLPETVFVDMIQAALDEKEG